MTPTYHFHRDKHPKTHRFPLRRRTLDSALGASGVQRLTSVSFALGSGKGVPLIYIFFTPDGFPGVGAGNTRLVVYAVPVAEVAHATVILEEGLPRICAWLARAEHAGNVWRWQRHLARGDIVNGSLHLVGED